MKILDENLPLEEFVIRLYPKFKFEFKGFKSQIWHFNGHYIFQEISVDGNNIYSEGLFYEKEDAIKAAEKYNAEFIQHPFYDAYALVFTNFNDVAKFCFDLIMVNNGEIIDNNIDCNDCCKKLI